MRGCPLSTACLPNAHNRALHQQHARDYISFGVRTIMSTVTRLRLSFQNFQLVQRIDRYDLTTDVILKPVILPVIYADVAAIHSESVIKYRRLTTQLGVCQHCAFGDDCLTVLEYCAIRLNVS